MCVSRFFACLILGLGLAGSSMAQYVEGDTPASSKAVEAPKEDQGSFFDRLNYGGNFGAQFGSYTMVNISPTVTYRFTDRLWAGPGVTYIYYSQSDGRGRTISSTVYGGSLVGRYQVLEQLFLQTQLESLSVPVYYINTNTNEITLRRQLVVSPLVGAGYLVPFNKTGSGVFLTALYNLNYKNSYGLYASPFIFRVGFAL